MTLRFYWQVWSILSNIRIILLGRKLIFDDFFFSCISRITVFWGKPANLPALKKTPLQRCTYCTMCSAPPSVEGGGGGGGGGLVWAVPMVLHWWAGAGWSRAGWKQLCTPGAITPPSTATCLSALPFPKREAGLLRGCLERPSLAGTAWASLRWVRRSASSWGNMRRSWLVHLIDQLTVFQQWYKSPPIFMSFSELNTKEILTSLQCWESCVLPNSYIYSLQG